MYLYSGSSYNGVLARDKEGTAVILAQFPSSGGLEAFGLTPSSIKTLAPPNEPCYSPPFGQNMTLRCVKKLRKVRTFAPKRDIRMADCLRLRKNRKHAS